MSLESELLSGLPMARKVKPIGDVPYITVGSGCFQVVTAAGTYDLWKNGSEYVKPNASLSEAVGFLLKGLASEQ